MVKSEWRRHSSARKPGEIPVRKLFNNDVIDQPHYVATKKVEHSIFPGSIEDLSK